MRTIMAQVTSLICSSLIWGSATFLGHAQSAVAAEKKESKPAPMILDTRSLADFEKGRLAGAIHLDAGEKDFKHKAEKFDKKGSYQIYAADKKSAEKALKVFKKAGIKDVKNLGSLKEAAAKTKLACEGTEGCN